jgi:serine/threonine protein phosphatase PrpC
MATGTIGLDVYGCSDLGRVRSNNEDAFVVTGLMHEEPTYTRDYPVEIGVGAHGVLLAVSDGMGGAQAGEVASALALKALRRGLMKADRGAAEAALTASVKQANKIVWDTAIRTERHGMGATLTAVLIEGNCAYAAEVGDSRAYVFRGGALVQLTHDQSPAQQMIDAGTLAPDQVATFPYKNVILQAIGTKPDVVVAITRLALRRGDRLLLCSDGLSGKISDPELQSLLASTSDLAGTCRQLIEIANSRGGDDNITVVLADMRGDGLAAYTATDTPTVETLHAYSP